MIRGSCCVQDSIGPIGGRQRPPLVQAPVPQHVGRCWPQQTREVVLHPGAGQICVQQARVDSNGCVALL